MAASRLDGAFEGGVVDVDQAEAVAVARGPFEVVEQRPVDIAAHVDALVYAAAQGLQRAVDEGDAARVVVGGDAVFGDVDRPAGARGRQADGAGQRLRIELVAGGRHLGAGRRGDAAVGLHQYAGVGLHADEVAARGLVQPRAVQRVSRCAATGG